MGIFPEWMEEDYNKLASGNKIPVSSLVFGNRFKSDQTLNEYLIEFLLVFASAKEENLQEGKMQFHDITIEKKLSYWAEPRMALRRFIFYNKAKKKGSIPADETAYHEMIELLVNKIETYDKEVARAHVESIQDLFRGYAVVIKKRFWGARTLMPICPEFILCGADPNEKKRKDNVDWENNPESVDNVFSFDRHNFLARGGELYYLQLLQGLGSRNEKKAELEYLLHDLLGAQCKKISILAGYVQSTWEEQYHMDKKQLSQQLNLAFIPDSGYKKCGEYSVDELISYLSCKLHPISRIDVLAKGVMFQIMRMMSCRVADYLGKDSPAWIVDMKGETTDTVKKIAAESYQKLEGDFMTALNKKAREVGVKEEELMKNVREARINSLDIFKSKGKELRCIIPVNGVFERFSLSEDVVRFLVLSLIQPGDKMTLSMFLEKLYKHYGIVIGPEEYKKSLAQDAIETTLANSFTENVIAFGGFLKATGFLRELSDATSIVVNPYESIQRG